MGASSFRLRIGASYRLRESSDSWHCDAVYPRGGAKRYLSPIPCYDSALTIGQVWMWKVYTVRVEEMVKSR